MGCPRALLKQVSPTTFVISATFHSYITIPLASVLPPSYNRTMILLEYSYRLRSLIHPTLISPHPQLLILDPLPLLYPNNNDFGNIDTLAAERVTHIAHSLASIVLMIYSPVPAMKDHVIMSIT